MTSLASFLSPEQIDYVWSRVEKTGECWLWKGSLNPDGYGKITLPVNESNRTIAAHRLVWEMVKGEIPKGLLCCHSCDVRHCVNPSHIWLGTQKENIQDMVRKGRKPSKLKPKQVLEIYALLQENTLTYREIGQRFGVGTTIVRDIGSGKKWSHLTKADGSFKKKGCNLISNDLAFKIRILKNKQGLTTDQVHEVTGVSYELIRSVSRGKVYKNAGGPIKVNPYRRKTAY